ncbi:cyclase [Pseudonocardiaceae bacterium YIM PH 21723]|nr:cyclase [Pseudonocardiaceae bacterium YIM PH 21723]
MRRVEVDVLVCGEKALNVFDAIIRWERYPQLVPQIRSTMVHSTWPRAWGSSSWEVEAPTGKLRWIQEEHFLRDRLEVRFDMTSGDFESFAGRWVMRQQGLDTALFAEFDIDAGTPCVGSVLEPMIELTIREIVETAVHGMFPRIRTEGRLGHATLSA